MNSVTIRYTLHPSTGNPLDVVIYKLDEKTVDLIPDNIPNGNYRIYRRHTENDSYEVIYVGRVGNRTSDAGLKCRLKEHIGEWYGDLYFECNSQPSELFAYFRECSDFHQWKDANQARYNSDHPAKPKQFKNLIHCQICKV